MTLRYLQDQNCLHKEAVCDSLCSFTLPFARGHSKGNVSRVLIGCPSGQDKSILPTRDCPFFSRDIIIMGHDFALILKRANIQTNKKRKKTTRPISSHHEQISLVNLRAGSLQQIMLPTPLLFLF